MEDSIYDLDIAAETIFAMFILKCKQLDKEIDPNKKVELQKEVDMLGFEKSAVYSDGQLKESLIHKAFNLYSPQLKARYAAL
jgi:hypothetical protein